jgi:hypothetical protein
MRHREDYPLLHHQQYKMHDLLHRDHLSLLIPPHHLHSVQEDLINSAHSRSSLI